MGVRATGRDAGLGLLVLLLGACAAAPFDAGTLESAFPQLPAPEARALARTMPYVLPAAGRVTWFLCRHDTSLPLLVSRVGEARPEEEAALDAALAALERSVEPLRFVRVPPDEAALHVEFVEGLVAGEQGEDQANTIADCRVGAEVLDGRARAVVPASLVQARVRVGRGGPRDPLGRERPLDQAELAGVLLHELAHALGLPGHREGHGLLTRSLEELGALGRDALAGRRVEVPALAGLYRLAPGTVLASAEVPPARTHLVDRLGRLAEGTDTEGPYVRVGDTLARIYWRDAQGREYGMQIPFLEEVLRRPGRLVILPEARTRRALPRSNDPAGG